MARKITMFELHFDGAQIGPASLDFAEDTPASEDHASVDEMGREREMETEMGPMERPSGGRRLRTLVAIAGVVSIVSLVGVAVRRFRSDSEDLEIEIDDESDEDVLEERI